MLPSNYKDFPMDSIFKSWEHERVALNIMMILSRTGNRFRPISWDEYKNQRLRDKGFTERERAYFNAVKSYCTSSQAADLFSPKWRKRFSGEIHKENRMPEFFETLDEAIFMLIQHGYEIQFYGPVNGNATRKIWVRIIVNEDEVMDKLLEKSEIISSIEDILRPHIYELSEEE